MVSDTTVQTQTKVEVDHVVVRRPQPDVIVLDESPKNADGDEEFFDFTDSEEKSMQKDKRSERQKSPENKRGRARKYMSPTSGGNSRRSPRRSPRRAVSNDVGNRNRHSNSKGFQLESDSGSDVVFIGDNRKELQDRRRRYRSSRYSRERSSSRKMRRRNSDRYSRRSLSTDRNGYRRRRSRSRRHSRERSRERSKEHRPRSKRVSRFSSAGPSQQNSSNLSIKPEGIKPESVKPEIMKPETIKPEGMKPEDDVQFIKFEGFCGCCGQRGHSTRACPRRQNNIEINVICFACGKQGHVEDNCTRDVLGVLKRLKRQEKEAEEMKTRICHNCGEMGHTKKFCKNETKEWRQCHNCGERGHLKMSCTNPTNPNLDVANRVKCFNCGNKGHIRKHCPDVDKGPKCYKCSEFGHIATGCQKDGINVRAQTSERYGEGDNIQAREGQVSEAVN